MKQENRLLRTDEEMRLLEAYCRLDGYEVLKQALQQPESIIPALNKSGLKGRSGSNFPVGVKWQTTYDAVADEKFIVCNADEGEPETNKDREVLMNNPFLIIEGMTIAAAVVKAKKGFIYLRAEYPYVVPILESALDQARQAGYLGENILGSGLDFDIELRVGAGAYICGEETALLESLEGKRGETRLKPPFPGVSGYMGKPTIINNVETLASIPLVLRTGKETKLVTLSGCVKNPGVYEIPLGFTIRELYQQFGGGCPEGDELFAIQTGGQSGPIVTPELMDTVFTPDDCREAGTFFGTGSLMFIAADVDFMGLIHNIMEFFAEESCGKCVPCRLGTSRLAEITGEISCGRGTRAHLKELQVIAGHIQTSGRCALGKASVTPLLSSLQNFSEVYDQSINEEVEQYYELYTC